MVMQEEMEKGTPEDSSCIQDAERTEQETVLDRQTHESDRCEGNEYEPSEASGHTTITSSQPPLVVSGSAGHTMGHLTSLPHLQQPCCLSVGTTPQLATHLQNSVRTHHFRNSNCGGDYHQQGNDDGNLSRTNIYIRGLPKEFTDHDLNRLCQSVGRIRSLKAIMDKDTNRCKGYGFVDFETAESASAALWKINQHTNYHAQMAKQQEQDPTNLYFANLSSEVNEVTLEEVLGQYGTVISARILRDNNARSKGVGFARMENKEICDNIIDALNGKQENRLGDREVLVKFADGSKKPKHHVTTSYLHANSHNSNFNRFNNTAFGQVAANLFQQHGGSAFYPSSLQANAAELLGSTFAAAALAAATSTPAPPYVQANPLQQHQFEYNGPFCAAPNGYYRNTSAGANCSSAIQSFGPYNTGGMAAPSNQQVFVINPAQLGCPAVNETAQITEIIPSGIDESHSPCGNDVVLQHQQHQMAGFNTGSSDISTNSELAPYLNNNKTVQSTATPAYILTPAAAGTQQHQQIANALGQMNISNNPQQAQLSSSQAGFFPCSPIQPIQGNPQNQFATPINPHGIVQAYAAAALYQQLAAAATANLYQAPSIQQLINTVGCNTNNPAFMTTHPTHQLGVNCNGHIGPSGYISMSPNAGPSAYILSYLPPNPTIDENVQGRCIFPNSFNPINGYPAATFLSQPSSNQPWPGNNNMGFYMPPDVNVQAQRANIISSNNSSPDDNLSSERAGGNRVFSRAAGDDSSNRTDPSTSPDEGSRTKTSSEVSENSNATTDEEQRRRSSCGTDTTATSDSRWSSADNVQGQANRDPSNENVSEGFTDTVAANEDREYSVPAKAATVNTVDCSRNK